MAQLKGGTYVAGDIFIDGNIYCGGIIKGKQLTVTCGSTTNIDMELSENYYILLNQNTTISVSNVAQNIGKSGLIILKQDSTGGRTFIKPSEFKTPIGGATISQITTANTLSMLSYYIVDSTTIIINYIGDFA